MQNSRRPLVSINYVKRFPGLSLIIAVLLIIIILVAIILPRITLVSGPATIIGLPDSETVIIQIQNIGKMETVSYTLEQVIAYDQDAHSLWRFLGDHKKLFVVQGEVIAGFELTNLSKQNIEIQEKNITVNLPAPQILETILDEEKMSVYDANTGLYGIWSEGLDSNTQLQILAAAKISLRNDAWKENILQKSSDSARQQFASFLMAIGFKNVTINIPNGRC